MTSGDRAPPSWPLLERPGFLIRRLHQIHVALFASSCARFDITPVQYSLLSVLERIDRADQTRLAAELALDRTTVTGALRRLEGRGLVDRPVSRRDRRARDCRLTAAGRKLLARMEPSARKAHGETIAALDAASQRRFMRLLEALVAAHEKPESLP